jgi:coatomer protein complex subunit epsilon
MTSSLFSVCNAFHLGAYQVAINEASELNDTELSATERVEKDCYAYRSYVALGSYQVRIVVVVVALFFFSLFFSLSLL